MKVLQNQVPNALAEETATMRTLIGVDRDELYISAIDLLGRLRFAGNRATLAHFDPAVGAQLNPTPLVFDYESAAGIEQTLRNIGGSLLETSGNAARKAGLGECPNTVYAVGNSSTSLLDLADTEHSDLIAIGSRRHGAVESFFLGSVGRALAIGAHQSFLIARGEPKVVGPVRAVFGTDQSAYADRCFARLLDMDPQGLAHVTIVTARETGAESELCAQVGYDDRSTYAVSDAEDRMRKHGDEMAMRLAAKGISAEFRFAQGHPAEALKAEMAATNSDLLILGARGHGFIERILIGSLALHVVVAEPYSVLVLRMPA